MVDTRNSFQSDRIIADMRKLIWLTMMAAAAPVAISSALPVYAQTTQDAAANYAAATPDTPDTAKIKAIETSWAEALVKKDQYALDLALAPTYVGISATGEVTTKNQQIAHLFTPNYGVLGYDETITSIRVQGDTAVAQGTYTLRRRWGNDVQEERGIFTHVYQRVRDTWQCINGQMTVVAQKIAPPRAAEKKDSLFRNPFAKKKPQGSSVTMVQPTPAPAAPAPAATATGTSTPAASGSTATDTPAPADAPPPVLENPK
jgi:ketosteroid isomerase-like protein